METKLLDGLLSQLRTAAAAASGAPGASRVQVHKSTDSGFAGALKSAVDRVNDVQQQSTQLAREFEMGAGNVQLHDVMISMQKANIALQQTVQVRNRLVSAYHDIMNMQV